MTHAVELRNISKSFGTVRANQAVSFAVEKGTIHALVGENGAGKTTLMNILFGILQPDGGDILIDGEPIVMHTPKTAIAAGVGMVHQHFKLVPSLTISENIFLGMELTSNGLIDARAQDFRTNELSDTFGLKVNPQQIIADVSVGVEQRVEILKVLARGARIIILDEPTAVLTPQESHELFAILRNFAKDGMTVIFISHHLDEVMEISDRVTVLRDGTVVDTVDRESLSEDQLIHMMVGREVNFQRRPRTASVGQVRLEARELCARDNRGLLALRDVSFKIRDGEILGVIGVDGNGQTELAEVISGLRRSTHGEIVIEDQTVGCGDPMLMRERGLAHVPADRLRRGVDAEGSIASNVFIGRQKNSRFVTGGWVLWRAVQEFTLELIDRFDIRTSGPEQAAGRLSGGNMQKVVLAREFSHNANVLLVDQPTRGVDIGAMERIHDDVMEQRSRGAAILLISSQIDEILTLADRVLVFFGGRISGELDANVTNEDEIGRLMAGKPLTDKVAA